MPLGLRWSSGVLERFIIDTVLLRTGRTQPPGSQSEGTEGWGLYQASDKAAGTNNWQVALETEQLICMRQISLKGCSLRWKRVSLTVFISSSNRLLPRNGADCMTNTFKINMMAEPQSLLSHPSKCWHIRYKQLFFHCNWFFFLSNHLFALDAIYICTFMSEASSTAAFLQSALSAFFCKSLDQVEAVCL